MTKELNITESQDLARKGGEADAAQRYLFRTGIEKLFRAIKRLGNAKPELSELLDCRAEIKYLMSVFQKTEQDRLAGKLAVKAVVEMGIGKDIESE